MTLPLHTSGGAQMLQSQLAHLQPNAALSGVLPKSGLSFVKKTFTPTPEGGYVLTEVVVVVGDQDIKESWKAVCGASRAAWMGLCRAAKALPKIGRNVLWCLAIASSGWAGKHAYDQLGLQGLNPPIVRTTPVVPDTFPNQ